MPTSVTITMIRSDYAGLSNTDSPASLSEFDRQVILSIFQIALSRDVWDGMTDSDWDDWEARLSETLSKI